MSLNLTEFNNVIMHNWAVERLAEARNVSLEESRKIISEMSFAEYHALYEDGTAIVPPSGNTITPTPTSSGTAPTAASPGGLKSIWPGKGAPLEVGMTVGLKGPNGLPVPGEVSQVDMASNGVKIKNPTTGQEEWQNTANLNPYIAGGAAAAPPTAGTPATGVNTADQQPGIPTATTEDIELARMCQLAGIKENCSAGATGAGSIATAPVSMSPMQKRQPTTGMKKEYTRTTPVKTIVGDTKPHQASGELSANLAASGMKSAGRTNNGMKRKK